MNQIAESASPRTPSTRTGVGSPTELLKRESTPSLVAAHHRDPVGKRQSGRVSGTYKLELFHDQVFCSRRRAS